MSGPDVEDSEEMLDVRERTQARKAILAEAHEGHEEYQPKRRVKRVGPRKWAAMSEMGYDYTETLWNWEPSRAQILGFVIMLIGLVVILLIALHLAPWGG